MLRVATSLSMATMFAVGAVLELAESPGSPETAEKLAKDLGVADRFISAALSALVQNGILRCRRGDGDGLELVDAPVKISLLRIIEAIEGPLDATPTMPADFPDPARSRLVEALEDIAMSTRERLGDLTIGDLMKPADMQPR